MIPQSRTTKNPYSKGGYKMIKILVADDQELIRQSLEIVLNSRDNLKVIDTVANGQDVIRSVRANKPDIILMDIRMPKIDGVQCTQIIKEFCPDIKIIILTTFDDDEYVYNALKYGASGYLLKGVSMDELVNAIETVYSGRAMINPDIATKVVRLFSQMAKGDYVIQVGSKGKEELTKTEWKIIQQIELGASNKEIADKLNLSDGTVRNYLSAILNKLELRDRTQLAIWAVQAGVDKKNLE
jgi:DNA-binding NarL/FixJ family response regulator